MLLGSPPDMVHGALSHRTRIPACQGARPACLMLIVQLAIFAYNTLNLFTTEVDESSPIVASIIIIHLFANYKSAGHGKQKRKIIYTLVMGTVVVPNYHNALCN